MRAMHLPILVVATALVTYVLATTLAPPSASTSSSPDIREEQIEDLLLRNRELTAEVSRLEAELHAERSRGPVGSSHPDPSGVLDELVTKGGRGEALPADRLAELRQAARQIPEEIAAQALRTDLPERLRAQLLYCLGNAEFRGNPTVLDTLITLARPGTGNLLESAAWRYLRVVGEASTLESIAPLVLLLGDTTIGSDARETYVVLAGSRRNEELAKLFAAGPGDAACVDILSRLRVSEPRTALPLLRESLTRSRILAMAAAEQLGAYRDPEAKRLLEERLAAETDPEVRKVLVQAKQRQAQVPKWHAQRATGSPDVDNIRSDHPNAWATHRPDGGHEWIELTYDPPLRAFSARIHEVLRAGAVVRLLAAGEAGSFVEVWRGEDPLTEPGIFEVDFPMPAFPVKRLKVELDTKRRQGWNEIDAVELVGPDGNAWATDAAASSNYGEG